MRPHREVFDFEIDFGGASIVVIREPLTSAALSDEEVDWQIEALKNNLDKVAKRMKAAIRKQAIQPLFGDT